MFYYYGRKKRIAHLYPLPIFDTIIEPFAGSAAYSLHGKNWKKQVILCDINPNIIGIWNYLKRASIKDILALPDFKPGEKTTDCARLTDIERRLIGLHISPGKGFSNITCSKLSRWKTGKEYISENLYKIKHWQIISGTYSDVKNRKATWFIDPPYQKAGKHYIGGNKFDFPSLGEWCRSRHGQIIVCEADGAEWLPFKFLIDTKNAGKHRSKEVVWVG